MFDLDVSSARRRVGTGDDTRRSVAEFHQRVACHGHPTAAHAERCRTGADDQGIVDRDDRAGNVNRSAVDEQVARDVDRLARERGRTPDVKRASKLERCSQSHRLPARHCERWHSERLKVGHRVRRRQSGARERPGALDARRDPATGHDESKWVRSVRQSRNERAPQERAPTSRRPNPSHEPTPRPVRAPPRTVKSGPRTAPTHHQAEARRANGAPPQEPRPAGPKAHPQPTAGPEKEGE